MERPNDLGFLHDNFDGKKVEDKGQDPTLPEIYLVEDDRTLGATIKRYLEKCLCLQVRYFTDPGQCLEAITTEAQATGKKEFPHLLITDISFDHSNVDGLLLIDLLKERGHRLPSIVMTGFASIETAINATKKGVFHYLTKPFELAVLADLVAQLVSTKLGIPESSVRSRGPAVAPAPERGPYGSAYELESPCADDFFSGMLGRSKRMRELFERIHKVAASDSTALISGPSGTGKELVANAIHSLSTRQAGPMVSINCGAIPSELLESELFGHVKGAFTGALSDRKGRFEAANRGTMFLDEIGDMPLLLQVKLLRVLQNRCIEKVGGTETIPVNVRIIAATHRDLDKAVREGNFREDLFYRLNVIPIRVPSLNERKEDLPLLISHFTSRFVSADGRNRIKFDKDTIELLVNYSWPGNVRELENLIERLVILRGGNTIRPSDLPAKLTESSGSASTGTYDGPLEQIFKMGLPEEGLDLKKFLSDVEDGLIEQALTRCGHNKNQASRLLKMNRTTLIEKLKKKGILSDNALT